LQRQPQEGGIANVNKGYMATMLRDSVASFFYFSTYAILKHAMTPEGIYVTMLHCRVAHVASGADGVYTVYAGQAQPSAWGTLFAGGMAGIFNWLGCIPIDTLKTKLQTAPEGTLYLPLFSALHQ
jgi:solute carrier family 25 carnitine/acylcarnitine transporter 20/29